MATGGLLRHGMCWRRMSDDIKAQVMVIDIDEAGDTITVRVSADLAPLFPDFALALDHTIVREGEAQVRMRAWMP